MFSVGIVWLNFYSLNEFAAKFQIIATVAKLGSMALIIVAGFYLLIFKGEYMTYYYFDRAKKVRFLTKRDALCWQYQVVLLRLVVGLFHAHFKKSLKSEKFPSYFLYSWQMRTKYLVRCLYCLSPFREVLPEAQCQLKRGSSYCTFFMKAVHYTVITFAEK